VQVRLREARKEDIPQMLNLYKEFSRAFVGPASRNLNDFRRMLRRKDNINWVALESQDQIAGYVHAHFDKRTNQGDFREIVVNPRHDFERVARPLVERVNKAFIDKKVDVIGAGSLRNPIYEKVFPSLGFFESESMGVFMFAILDAQRFLNELAPAFFTRLKKSKERSVLVQVECEGHSIYLQKAHENVEPFVFTNKPVDFKVILTREILTKLVFGIVDSVESLRTGKLQIETSLSQQRAHRLLRVLFPKKQFLIMDFW
jgi:hypothetical protein